MSKVYSELNATDARIFRIVHRDNMPWILENGLYCGNSDKHFNQWVSIGNPDLTSDRGTKKIDLPCGKTTRLNDYAPFYFTPFSPMLYNILNGTGEITQRKREEIIILVSSMLIIQKKELPFPFTNGHAKAICTTFYDCSDDLSNIDWPILQHRDFKRNFDDPGKLQRYQAEALVSKHCPVDALKGIVCYNDEVKNDLEQQIKKTGLTIRAKVYQ